MAAGAPFIFIPAKQKLLKGKFNLSADALKAALCTSAQPLSAGFIGASGDARYADLSAEVASGGGYTTGGQALTGVALSYFVASATILNGGSAGSAGTQTVTGTSGAGTKFQAQVSVNGGAIVAVNGVTLPGAYSTLPTDPTQEPVSGAGLTGAKLALQMGVALTFADPAWPSATLTAKYLVVYDSTLANKDLIAAVDLEQASAAGISVSGGTVTYPVGSAFVQLA